jgi:hypothetical protein
MFFSYLEKIRNSSPQKKKIFSFGLALFITGFIFIIWLKFWLPVDMEKIKNSGKTFKDEPSITVFFDSLIRRVFREGEPFFQVQNSKCKMQNEGFVIIYVG